MKRLIVILSFMFLLCSSAYAQQQEQWVVTATSLNVRSGPGTGYAVIGKMSNGETFVGASDGEWVTFSYGGVQGYVSSRYLENQGPVAEPQETTIASPFIKRVSSIWDSIWSVLKIILIILGILIILAFKDAIVGLIGALIGFGIIAGAASLISNLIFGTPIPGIVLFALFLIAALVGWIKDHSGFFDGTSGTNWFTTILCLPLIPCTIVFFFLNRLQFFIQKPWRIFLKHKTSPLAVAMRKHPNTAQVIEFALYTVGYIIATPLRIINAIYYNLIFRFVVSFCDGLMELIAPKLKGARFKYGWKYLGHWLTGFPLRLVVYLAKQVGILIESAVMVAVDTVYPTITMMHGTAVDASAKITKPGQWIVGGGNYAGSGIYFGISLKTAYNYTKGAIIISRVAMGRTINLTVCPSWVTDGIGGQNRNAVGKRITDWGLSHKYVTSEWWRSDGRWWEYCLLDAIADYDHPWRIRPICVRNNNFITFKRIWGGMSFWVLDKIK